MTNFVKKNEINNRWDVIDAENLVVGRLAAYVSGILRGKNKSQYTPGMDNGDFVIITNIEKIKFTGKKFSEKKYYKHTGFPGGIKTSTPESISKNKRVLPPRARTLQISHHFRHTAVHILKSQ